MCETLQQSKQGCLNIPLIQGDAQDFRLAFQPPFNLADYTITMDVKKHPSVLFRSVFRKTTGDGLTVEKIQEALLAEGYEHEPEI